MHEEHIIRLNDVRELIDILIRLVGAFCCPMPLTKHPEIRGGINDITTFVRVYFFFNYFDNIHDVNVGNKKGARYAPGMENISHVLNKPGML